MLPCKKDEKYVEKLSTWADVIRKTYFDGGVDEIISTRRLVHIVQAYSIFGNKMKAIELCTNRFDDDTKASFVDLYTKVHMLQLPKVSLKKKVKF